MHTAIKLPWTKSETISFIIQYNKFHVMKVHIIRLQRIMTICPTSLISKNFYLIKPPISPNQAPLGKRHPSSQIYLIEIARNTTQYIILQQVFCLVHHVLQTLKQTSVNTHSPGYIKQNDTAALVTLTCILSNKEIRLISCIKTDKKMSRFCFANYEKHFRSENVILYKEFTKPRCQILHGPYILIKV